MKRVLLFVVLVTALGLLSACGSSEQFDLESESEFVVGLEAAYAPFNWSVATQNEYTVALDGQPGVYVDGYDVVVASLIADELGLELVIKAIDWDGLIPALLAGEIDMIIAGMSPTAERAQTVAFSEEYFRSEQVMVVSTTGNYTEATSLSDFDGARVVAQLGTLQDDLIDQIPNVNHLEPLDSYGLLGTAVAQNAADAFIAELPVAQGMVAANSNLEIIQFTGDNGFEVSAEDVIVSVALRQEDVNLLNAVNAALATISSTERNQIMADALSRQPQE
ncbi:MAG: ABC transporter substrate-binding protein [Acholeplasma sp.]|jgi:ABC-type amino acid transport substrate-binding protein|nr:MAG: ABC transporter substrate-binding protein [Acholeplasma sp.]